MDNILGVHGYKTTDSRFKNKERRIQKNTNHIEPSFEPYTLFQEFGLPRLSCTNFNY